MSIQEQQLLGKTLWEIADQLRGAMNADDFRDYMLSLLFLRYLSYNYEDAVKKELGSDYPETPEDVLKKLGVTTPLQLWYEENLNDVHAFEKQGCGCDIMSFSVSIYLIPKLFPHSVTFIEASQG